MMPISERSILIAVAETNVGKVWWLNISYDETRDEFFAYVDDGTRAGVTVYQIDDTEEMVSYIETGVMKHIDDVEGLTRFLIKQEFIEKGDIIRLQDELLW